MENEILQAPKAEKMAVSETAQSSKSAAPAQQVSNPNAAPLPPASPTLPPSALPANEQLSLATRTSIPVQYNHQLSPQFMEACGVLRLENGQNAQLAAQNIQAQMLEYHQTAPENAEKLQKLQTIQAETKNLEVCLVEVKNLHDTKIQAKPQPELSDTLQNNMLDNFLATTRTLLVDCEQITKVLATVSPENTAQKLEKQPESETAPAKSESESESVPSPTQILNAMNQKDITFGNLYVQTGDNLKSAQLTASDMVKKVAYGADDDNGEIEVKKADKNATNTKDKKNKIIIRQTHYFNQAFFNAVSAKQAKINLNGDTDWKARLDTEIAEVGMANGEKKFTTIIAGESWEVEFHLKVEEYIGSKEEFQAFMSQNNLINVILPFTPAPVLVNTQNNSPTAPESPSTTSQSDGRTMILNVSEVPNKQHTSIHEMLHNMGLHHDNTIDKKNGMPSMMSYIDNRVLIDNDIKNLVKNAVELAKKEKETTVTVRVTVNTGTPITHNKENLRGVVNYRIEGKDEVITLPTHGSRNPYNTPKP